MKKKYQYSLDLANVKLSVNNIFPKSYLKCIYKKTRLFRISVQNNLETSGIPHPKSGIL